MPLRSLRAVTCIAASGAVAALFVGCQRKGSETGNAPATPPPTLSPTPQLNAPSQPVIVSVRKAPMGTVEVRWTESTASDAAVDSFALDRWDSKHWLWEHAATAISKDQRTAVDSLKKENGVTYGYQVVAKGKSGKVAASAHFDILWNDRPLPQAVQGLTGRIVRNGGDDIADLSWAPKNTGDSATSGFLVYVSKGGEDVGQAPGILVRQPRCAIPVHRPVDSSLAVQVCGVDVDGQEGERAEIKLDSLESKLPAPASIHASRGESPSAPILVTWAFEGQSTISGFRLYEHGRRIADETVLGPNLRQWPDPYLTPGRTYQYAVEAVAPNGERSALVSAEPFTLSAAAKIPVAPPRDATASWGRSPDGGFLVILSWSAPVEGPSAQFQFDYDKPAGGKEFTSLPGSPAVQGGLAELRVTPPDGVRSYRFAIRQGSSADAMSAPAELNLEKPDRIVPVPRLSRYRILGASAGGTQVEWSWTYPGIDWVTGFRIYENGKLCADEKTLGGSARIWSSGPIAPAADFYRFEIEAVLADGTVTARGPERYFFNPPR